MSSESGSCEEIRNGSVLGGLGNSAIHISRSIVIGENDNNELVSDVEEKGAEDLKSVTSPSPTRRSYGLKKWRRIKRDVSKVGEGSVDNEKMVMQELSSSVVHPSKRTQVYAKRHQKIEDSVSSTNPVVEDSVSSTNPVVEDSVSSTSSEDSSSKYEMPIVVGTPLDESRVESLSGKNLAYSRGEQVRMEKETSHSSIESDSRSSNCVYVQGPYTTSNGIQSERPVHCDRGNGDEQVRNGLHGREKEGALHVQNEKREKLTSFLDQDPLIESIFELKTAQEALEKEVLKFKEIIEQTSIRYSALDTQPDFEYFGAKFQETGSGKREKCEDIASADATLKLQKRVCVYTSYFFMQLLLLILILGVFVFQFSPNYAEVVPT